MAKPAVSGEMPFLDHLEELRWRLVWALGALAVGIMIAFAVATKFDIITVMTGPIRPYLASGKLVVTNPGDPFRITMTLSFILGSILALPVIVYQIWRFVAPALYAHEKKVVVAVLVFAAALFLAGASLAFFIVLPYSLAFLLQFQSAAFDNMITASGYFGFAFSMSLALGAAFELPIIVLALTALGLVTPRLLHRLRRHAIVFCIVASAFITPGGDPFSLAALAVPLYFLYELSVVLSAALYRRKQRKAAASGELGAPA